MENNLKYKKILLKISGEALLGDQEFGIDPKPENLEWIEPQVIMSACLQLL